MHSPLLVLQPLNFEREPATFPGDDRKRVERQYLRFAGVGVQYAFTILILTLAGIWLCGPRRSAARAPAALRLLAPLFSAAAGAARPRARPRPPPRAAPHVAPHAPPPPPPPAPPPPTPTPAPHTPPHLWALVVVG